jgi:hypothetical protein
VKVFSTFRLSIEKGHPMMKHSIHVTNRVRAEIDARTRKDMNANFKISETEMRTILKDDHTGTIANNMSGVPTKVEKMALTT